jgi:hypothetical protein
LHCSCSTFLIIQSLKRLFFPTRIYIFFPIAMAASHNNPPSDFPPYAAHRLSYSFDPNLPPAPPPKPSSQEVSRQGTPAANQSLPPPPLGEQRGYTQVAESQQDEEQARVRDAAERLQDPGDRWLPRLLQDKSYGSSSRESTRPCD